MTPPSRAARGGGRSAPAPPPPRKFRQARSQASFERILGAALALYGEQGFHATQTTDIAERAGMSVGGLYRYFRDKHEIFREVIHRGLEQNRRTQDQAIAAIEARLVEGGIEPRALAEMIVNWTWAALHPVPPDLLRTFAAMAYLDPDFAALNDQYDRYEREALARVLGKLTSRQRIRSPLAAARLVDLIVPQVAIWTALHPDDSRGVKEATIDMLTRYLAEA